MGTSFVRPNSLAATLDAVDEALFFGQPITKAARIEVARWIAARQGLPGSYTDMPAPTDDDFHQKVKVFTGESAGGRGGLAHVLGEEACRALILLNVPTVAVREALGRASEGILARARRSGSPDTGMYCCGKCSPALWRHLTARGDDEAEAWLAAGMRTLNARRVGDGKWRPFQFWYTILAVSDIDLPAADEELRYAAPVLERALSKRTAGYGERRRALAERVLARL